MKHEDIFPGEQEALQQCSGRNDREGKAETDETHEAATADRALLWAVLVGAFILALIALAANGAGWIGGILLLMVGLFALLKGSGFRVASDDERTPYARSMWRGEHGRRDYANVGFWGTHPHPDETHQITKGPQDL